MKDASLAVVGIGIEVPAHVTAETKARLECADEVLFLVADPLAASWITSVNPRSRSLHTHFRPGGVRSEAYAAIVEDILGRVRRGGEVCVALYGHPGVYAWLSHEVIRRADGEGISARMLPAVSAEDCFFADLGVDPGASGCQSYDATDLLIRRRELDPSAALILWQVAIVGRVDCVPEGDLSQLLPLLVEYLERYYPSDHEVVAYAASPYPFLKPIIRRFPLSSLPESEIPRLSLLYIPPAIRRAPDLEMLESSVQTEAEDEIVATA